jgi:hypothetical protein
MSSGATNGSSWIDVAVPIESSAKSGITNSPTTVTFNDGSFTTAATPTPGLTAGLTNVTSGVASLGTAISNLTSNAQDVFMLVVGGGLLWLWLRKEL